MPCQEPPVAMSTWQASIHVPEGCVVLMSGNELVGITAAKDGQGKGIGHPRFSVFMNWSLHTLLHYELIGTHASVIIFLQKMIDVSDFVNVLKGLCHKDIAV